MGDSNSLWQHSRKPGLFHEVIVLAAFAIALAGCGSSDNQLLPVEPLNSADSGLEMMPEEPRMTPEDSASMNEAANEVNAAAAPSADQPVPIVPAAAAVAAVPVVVVPGPGRMLWAPNGAAWPAAAGYVDGYDMLRNGGLSRVTVDNSANGESVYLKLVAVDGTAPTPVRHIFIPAYGRFTMASVSPGTYDVRYMMIRNRSLVGSEQFRLYEIAEAGGTRYSDVTMTLYTVPDGNFRTHPLRPEEF
jgi:hypothetical protein